MKEIAVKEILDLGVLLQTMMGSISQSTPLSDKAQEASEYFHQAISCLVESMS